MRCLNNIVDNIMCQNNHSIQYDRFNYDLLIEIKSLLNSSQCCRCVNTITKMYMTDQKNIKDKSIFKLSIDPLNIITSEFLVKFKTNQLSNKDTYGIFGDMKFKITTLNADDFNKLKPETYYIANFINNEIVIQYE